tara:strand:- start:6796 stop:7260 length:465 start_codon:yes stop_codon:yes gene_type:complete
MNKDQTQQQPTEMISTTSTLLTHDTVKKPKGFGRGWGHGQKYKTSDKFRYVEKPPKKKEFKLGRNAKSSLLDEEYVHSLNEELFEEVLFSKKKLEWDDLSDIFSMRAYESDDDEMNDFMWFGVLPCHETTPSPIPTWEPITFVKNPAWKSKLKP